VSEKRFPIVVQEPVARVIQQREVTPAPRAEELLGDACQFTAGQVDVGAHRVESAGMVERGLDLVHVMPDGGKGCKVTIR